MIARREHNPLLSTLLTAAVDATQAGRGWLLAVRGDELHVVSGSSDVGAHGPRAGGWAGFVATSQRPMALAPNRDDPRFASDFLIGAGPRPTTLLCFPCKHGGETVGALLLVDKAAGAPFDLDDVDLIGLLAEVAGAAIAEAPRRSRSAPPPPEELGAELQSLATTDPNRYAAVAAVVGELLLKS